MDAVLWLVAGGVLLVVEVFTLTVFALLLGVGALAASLAAALGAPLGLQAGVFAASSTALVVFARGPVQRAINAKSSGPELDPGKLTGQTATVVQRVSDDSGQVRLSGELWRARPYAGGPPVEVGVTVHVAAVDGATLLVYSPALD